MYLHFVWGTYRRAELISPEVEARLYPLFLEGARKAGCEIVAIGGIADHVHIAVRMGTTVAPAVLIHKLKGASAVVGKEWTDGRRLRWQDGYSVFSFSRSHYDRVIEYIRNQKRHHAERRLWMPWETLGSRQNSATASQTLSS